MITCNSKDFLINIVISVWFEIPCKHALGSKLGIRILPINVPEILARQPKIADICLHFVTRLRGVCISVNISGLNGLVVRSLGTQQVLMGLSPGDLTFHHL